jgi:hypothetical protein
MGLDKKYSSFSTVHSPNHHNELKSIYVTVSNIVKDIPPCVIVQSGEIDMGRGG